MDVLAIGVMLKALDGLSARASATAQNIANASSPNYRPVRVTFEQALAEAARGGDLAGVEAVRPRTEFAASAETGEVRLDQELADQMTTAMRYSALVDVLSRRLSLDRAAIRGNA